MKHQKGLRLRTLTAALIASLVLSGGFATSGPATEVANAVEECVHPYPCGDEWPAELANRNDFTLESVTSVGITSPGDDGVEVQLDGWLAKPDLPEGVKAPTIIFSSPYFGLCGYEAVVGGVDALLAGSAGQGSGIPPIACAPTPADPNWWSDTPAGAATIDSFTIRPKDLIARGFALLYVSVRGTGRSEGCLELFGPNEQQDQVEIVKWAAGQPWSNGAVAMGGVSYLAGTAWSGAIKAAEQGVEALKTTITSGVMSDLYTVYFTPQGSQDHPAILIPQLLSRTTFVPPVGAATSDASAFIEGSNADPRPETDWLTKFDGRACPETLEWISGTNVSLTGDRAKEFFEDRRLISDFPKVTAASLVAHGLLDFGHRFQDEGVWAAASRSPKWQVAGLWGHEFPSDAMSAPATIQRRDWWTSSVFAWLDYWLKGIGSPPRLGMVDYQDTSAAWHEARSWPPSDREVALHLAPEGLVSATDKGGESRFIAAPDPRSQQILFSTGDPPFSGLAGPLGLCTEPVDGLSAKFETSPIVKRVLLAGNPSSELLLRSSQPGGIVSVDVAVISPDFTCTGGVPSGATWISHGSADLEFHSTRYSRTPFPVNEPARVRIDLDAVTQQLKPGDRLAVLVSRGDTTYYSAGAPQHHPEITLLSGSEGSKIVLPIAKGKLDLARAGR